MLQLFAYILYSIFNYLFNFQLLQQLISMFSLTPTGPKFPVWSELILSSYLIFTIMGPSDPISHSENARLKPAMCIFMSTTRLSQY